MKFPRQSTLAAAFGAEAQTTAPASLKEPHVAVLFHRIGPYHCARLKATAVRLSVTAVEFSTVDSTYAWELISATEGFNRLTLFSGEAAHKVPTPRLYSRIREVLDQLKPDVIAIPGWFDRCSLVALLLCQAQGIPVVVMSETTPWDEKRRWWKEWVKSQVVKLCSAGLVGGCAHAVYLEQLGVEW